MLVELFTQAGGFVTRAEIPPFNAFPDVLIWGQRVFRHDRQGRYREAFTYAILPGQERPQVDVTTERQSAHRPEPPTDHGA